MGRERMGSGAMRDSRNVFTASELGLLQGLERTCGKDVFWFERATG